MIAASCLILTLRRDRASWLIQGMLSAQIRLEWVSIFKSVNSDLTWAISLLTATRLFRIRLFLDEEWVIGYYY